MCLLCVEVAKGKMTIREIAQAYRESKVAHEHQKEFTDVIKETYGDGAVEKVANELTVLFMEMVMSSVKKR